MESPEEEARPYRYARTFEVVQKERPLVEMDKEALKAYIKEILGAVTSEADADRT